MAPLATALTRVMGEATYQRDAFNAAQRHAALRKIAAIETLLSEISGCTDCSDERVYADSDVEEMSALCVNLREYFGGGAA